MKIPYEDGIKYLVLALVLLSLAYVFHPGQVLTRSDMPPSPISPIWIVMLGLGLASGLLGLIKIIQEANR